MMAVLTTKQRNKLSPTMFGEPAKRAYPRPDKAHAINAKARAKQQFDKGKLSKAELAHITTMANSILGGKRG